MERPERGSSAPLRQLQRSLIGSPEAAEAFDRIAGLACQLLRAEVGLVSLIEVDRQFFIGQHGLPEPWSETRQTPLSQSICHMVVTTRDTVQIDDTATDPRTEGHEAVTVLEVGSYLGVPLLDERGDPIGSLCAIDRHPHPWTVVDRQLLTDLSAAARSELRARVASAVAEDATRRVQILADASEALSRTLDVEATITTMLDLAVPALAPASLVHLVDTSDGERRTVFRRPRVGPGANAPTAVDALLGSEAVRAVLTGAVPHARMPFPLPGSAPGHAGGETLAVPLVASREVLGAWLLEAGSEARFDDLDVTVLRDLGRRAGAALRNARAFGRERSVSLRLQHDLLALLPDIEGLDVCATYQPSGAGLEVGGDWYDLAETPSGRVLATIGDVTGHDLRAAAAMGRVSAAIRCYGHDGLSPVDILSRLDGFSHHLLGDGLYATGICVALTRGPQGTSWSLEVTNAGHPPPLVIPRRGPPRLLETAVQPPLGVSRPRRSAATARLDEGDLLVLYSDGLIEHRHEDLDVSLGRLRTVARTLDAAGPLDECCQKLLVEADPSREDDIAVLILRPIGR